MPERHWPSLAHGPRGLVVGQSLRGASARTEVHEGVHMYPWLGLEKQNETSTLKDNMPQAWNN